jgi:hypothetical protein
VRARRQLTTALLGLLLLAGCAGPSGRRDVGSWLEARGADLMDTVGARVAVGPGLGVMARATRWLQLGAMLRGPSEQDLAGASTGAGDEFTMRSVPCFMFGTIGRYGGAWFETSRELAIPGYSTRDDVLGGIQRNIIAGVVSLDGRDDRWEWSLALGAHLLLLGADVEVRPLEALDFLAGLVGYDPSGDDVPVAPGGEAGDPGS